MPDKNAYLKAMGIDVWVEREPARADVIIKEVSSAEVPHVEVTVEKAAPLTDNHSVETLDWQGLRSLVSKCQACELSKVRKQTVFGEGNQTAPLMIIGDAPTEEDDKQGMVFSGEAGKLLTAMLKAMGYQRNDVYISNIVKCRTTQNQEPTENEAVACEPYLLRQINLLQPKLILALGSVAAHRLLKSKSTMARLRGQLHYVDGINAPVLVSYHPAYLLRAANEKRKAWDDLQMAMKELSLAGTSS